MNKQNRTVVNAIAVGFFLFGIGGLVACAGWEKNTCAAIDLAHQACATVTFVDGAGKQQTLQLTTEDARELGKAKAARARDAGK